MMLGIKQEETFNQNSFVFVGQPSTKPIIDLLDPEQELSFEYKRSEIRPASASHLHCYQVLSQHTKPRHHFPSPSSNTTKFSDWTGYVFHPACSVPAMGSGPILTCLEYFHLTKTFFLFLRVHIGLTSVRLRWE